MEKSELMKICIGKGFLLSKDLLDYFCGLESSVVVEIIDIFYRIGVKEKILTKKLFDSNISRFSHLLADSRVVDVGENRSVKVLSKEVGFSKKVETFDFVLHFKSRYESVKKIFEERNIENLSSIRRIGVNNGSYSIIGCVVEKRLTKNKNLLIDVEDLTGNISILVNKENSGLFSVANELLLDDIVVFKVTGSSEMLFASDIIFPDSSLEEERFGESDSYVAFSSDLHVGSKFFLEDEFLKFVSWLNCEVGDERQKSIASKVKYLFLTGDNIDGIGIFPEQDRFLKIKSCKAQYVKFFELISKIRKDINIIICPGQHDAVWVGEQQNVISDKWVGDFSNMKNVFFVTNPALVEIEDGFKVLMYHGAFINRIIDDIQRIRVKYGHDNPTKVVREMLKRRHLAPSHGLADYVPSVEGDKMVIDSVPDIIATADQHRAEVGNYNNVLMVASSCWQSKTLFDERSGNNPVPARVPLFNLKTREVKIIDFGGSKKVKDNMEVLEK